MKLLSVSFANRRIKSPPTRAEWIEIPITDLAAAIASVSAHTGGVD